MVTSGLSLLTKASNTWVQSQEPEVGLRLITAVEIRDFLRRHLVFTFSNSSSAWPSAQGCQGVHMSKSVQSMQGTMVNSSATPPPTSLVSFTILVPFLPQNKVPLLNGVSWHWWRTATATGSSFHSKGSVHEGRACDLHIPPEQGRLKVLKAYINLLECPIPLSVCPLSSVTKNLDHFSCRCISQTWSYGFLPKF